MSVEYERIEPQQIDYVIQKPECAAYAALITIDFETVRMDSTMS